MNLLLSLTTALLLAPNAAGGTALLLPPNTDGEMRKCQMRDIPGHIVVLDGEIVLDSRGTAQDTAGFNRVTPESGDIVSIEVRCLRVRSTEKESGWALRSAIIVLSKSGAPKVARAQLAELVEEQRLHFERTGRYAASLAELKFTETRTRLGIDLKVTDDGWSASVSFRDPGIGCRVAMGGAAAAAPELKPGVPVCAAADGGRDQAHAELDLIGQGSPSEHKQ